MCVICILIHIHICSREVEFREWKRTAARQLRQQTALLRTQVRPCCVRSILYPSVVCYVCLAGQRVDIYDALLASAAMLGGDSIR